MKLTAPLLTLVAAAVVAAAAGFLLLPEGPVRSTAAWTALALAFAAGLRPVRFPGAHMEFAAFFPIVFFAIPIFGPRVTVAACLLGVAGAAVGRPGWPRAPRFVFNLAAIALSAELAVLVYDLLATTREAVPLADAVVPMLGAVGTFAVVNTVLVGIAVAVEHRLPVLDAWQQVAERTAASFATGFTTALAMLAVYPGSIVWSLVVAAGPWWLIGAFSRRRSDAETDSA